MVDVTVIVPLYNKAPYVERCLNSVLRQTYEDFLVIVVDDGSTDDGPDLVRRYADERVQLVRQENKGPAGARNRGLRSASNEFIAFLDADDEWMPEFLERSVAHLKEYRECAGSVSNYYVDSASKGNAMETRKEQLKCGVWRLEPSAHARDVKRTVDAFTTCSVLWRREFVLRCGGFYEKNRCTLGEDSYLLLRAILRYKFYRDPEPLAWYHTHSSALTAQSRGPFAVWPMLTDPEPLRYDCPEEYRGLLERVLGYYALRSAHFRSIAGDVSTARSLLKAYPLSRSYRWYYLQVKMHMALSGLPILRMYGGQLARWARITWKA